MIGRTISHYRIVGQLGAGGMGVVYEAEDARLGRSVALKFVPEELARGHEAIERLRSEARTASALNHPGICTIYDIGEDDGRPYIVMERLKGQTLRQRLLARPIKIHDVLEMAIQIADALDWAHQRDVIHRDIKPANLFLVDHGGVKILDFGLAKLLAPRPDSELTTAAANELTGQGVTLGTVAYMSPEQVTGERLDGRTDLFSLGVVLYECVTGHQPFTGKTSGLVLSAILNRAPVAPVVFNAELPLRVQEIINNCLEKDRELRYQDAAGLRADLRRVKRDLESGQSGVVAKADRTAAAVRGWDGGGSDIPSPGPSATPQSSGQAVPGRGRRATTRGVRAGLFVGLLLLLSGAAYWTWPRGARAPDQAVRGVATRDSVGLATSSMQAKNYGAALAYAEEALRADANQADALRVRDEAKATLARFDEAIVRASALLDAGDADGATAALARARAIDPTSSAVAGLSARLVDRFKTDAEIARKNAQRLAAAPTTPSSPPRPTPDEKKRTDAKLVEPGDASARNPSATAPAAAPSPTPPLPPVSAPNALPGSQFVPAPSEPPAGRREAAQDAPPPPAPIPAAEDPTAAIRRIVATYARAIETKDLGLFQSVKPNLSAAERRRIEDGFRAVASQRVELTILSIELRGQQALVRLKRQDRIQVAGREQTINSQQTLTMIRNNAAWVIQEIGQ